MSSWETRTKARPPDRGRGFRAEAVGYRDDMSEFMEKAQGAMSAHDEQVDQGLEKAGDLADERTGGKFGEKIDSGVDVAQERTGGGDSVPDQPPA